KGRIREDDSSVPLQDGPYAYGTLFVTGGEQPKLYRTASADGEKEILLDGDAEAAGKAYFRIGGADHSHDHSRLLWGHDDKGSEYYTRRIRDLATGVDLHGEAADTSGAGVWDGKDEGFFFVRVDTNHRPSKLFHRTIGGVERLIYEESDPGYFMGV